MLLKNKCIKKWSYSKTLKWWKRMNLIKNSDKIYFKKTKEKLNIGYDYFANKRENVKLYDGRMHREYGNYNFLYIY